jgi:hypothetical protein
MFAVSRGIIATKYDTLFSDRLAFRARLPMQAVVRRYLSRGDILYLGVFHYHGLAPKWILHSRYTSRRLRDGVRGRNTLLYVRTSAHTYVIAGLRLSQASRGSGFGLARGHEVGPSGARARKG